MRICLLALAVLAASGGAAAPPDSSAGAPAIHAGPTFVYDDLDRFAEALAKVDAGADPVSTFDAYVAGGSPPMPFYVERYGATGASIAKAVARRPKHYHRVAALKPQVVAMQPSIERAIANLQAMIPGVATPPVYFMVGNLTAGGIHARLDPPPDGHGSAPAVLLETVAMSADTDMSEFPGAYSGAYLEDVPYVAVHEMVHAYQARIMGIGNYVSIYQPGPANTYLAQALREGCADYITLLAAGKRRKGNQESYGLSHEAELWSAFKDVMNKPLADDSWFGLPEAKHPDRPPQIGYWLGSRICQTYHESAADKAAALRYIFAAYSPEHMQTIAAPYVRKSR